MLTIIDYGGGNLGSLIAAMERRNANFIVSGHSIGVEQADAAVLPGDGAFGATMDALRTRDLDRAILDHIAAGKPFLGICVGMQVLFEDSDEFGSTKGLGVFKGSVSRFVDAPRVPHMGWNELEVTADHDLVKDLGPQPYAYFLHSYRVPVGPDTIAACTHGERFCAVAARGNVMGTQFHPEKSQHTGAKMLDNFLRFAGEDH